MSAKLCSYIGSMTARYDLLAPTTPSVRRYRRRKQAQKEGQGIAEDWEIGKHGPSSWSEQCYAWTGVCLEICLVLNPNVLLRCY